MNESWTLNLSFVPDCAEADSTHRDKPDKEAVYQNDAPSGLGDVREIWYEGAD